MNLGMCSLVSDTTLAWEAHHWRSQDCVVGLSPAALDEMRGFLASVGQQYDERSCSHGDFRKMALALPTLHREMAHIEGRFLRGGPGFAVIEALHPKEFSVPQLKLALACLSCHLGTLVTQNAAGEMIKEVRNRSVSRGPGATSYSDTRRGGNYHTDGVEIPTLIRYFPFYCVRQAAEGGATKLVNAYTIHNKLLANDFSSLKRLYEPFHWDRRYTLGPDGEPSLQKPVFKYEDQGLRCDYLRTFIEAGYRVAGLPVTEDVTKALDAMDRYLYDDRLAVDLALKPGQLVVSNNGFTLHGRSEFRDASSDPERQRLFLRSWVAERS